MRCQNRKWIFNFLKSICKILRNAFAKIENAFRKFMGKFRVLGDRFVKYYFFLNQLNFINMMKYRRESEFIHLPCPYRTVPYRFPRETVLVDRAAYRTFVTVFRVFCLKARTLPLFKFYRSSV
jgi:hypothetical protein